MQDFIFIAVTLIIISTIAVLYNTIKNKKKIANSIKQRWGKLPENEFDEYDLKNFSQLFCYRTKNTSEWIIDDTTWNDLEMDDYYCLINSTLTSMGDNALYSMLRTPLFSKEKHEERVRLIDYWSSNEETREKIQRNLADTGKFRTSRMDILVYESDFLQLNNKWLYKVLTFLPFAALPLMLINISMGLLFLIFMMGINSFYHEKTANKIHSGLEAIIQAREIVALGKALLGSRIVEFNNKFDRLEKLCNTLKSIFSKGSLNNFATGFSGNPVMDMLSLVNMVFLIDIWNYEASIDIINNRHEEIAKLIEEIGELDATISIASYRTSLQSYCKPEILWDNEDKSFYINAQDVIHPLIKSCTPNPVYASGAALLTGSNASGKSTYLKTVAINTLMAHTLGLCLAKKWVSRPLFTITSMALRDNILNGESYFIAEIKSLKRIFSMVNSEVSCLCIIDEVLRGTNTIERISASSRLLKSLAGKNTCIFAATHDTELTHILENVFDNKHFEEEITNDDIKFDYRIKDGRATSRNAINLLKIMGFEDDVVLDAHKAVEAFEQSNSWTKIV